MTFENHLHGTATDMTLTVDERDPVITGGFHNIDHINVVENQTIFHYVCAEDPDDLTY